MFNNLLQYYYITNYFHGYLMYVIALPIILLYIETIIFFTVSAVIIIYSMCSLAVSTQDSPAVEPRSNPGSGKILMSENLRLYTTSPVVMC